MSNGGFWDKVAEILHLKDVPFMGVPDYMFSIEYWLGAIAASALAWQAITGLILLLYYQPSDAYDSTMAIIHNVPFGSILLSSHLYGAYIMILAVYIHGLEVFFRGAYKRPRGAQWVLGVLLFAMTLGAAFVGYSLTGDVLSADAVNVGRGILTALGLSSAIPILFGNGTQLDLFTRLLGWHIIIAAALILFFALHFYLAEQNGFMPDLKESNYRAPALLSRSDSRLKPWWPRNFIFMLAIVLLTWGIILLIPSVLAIPQVLSRVPILLSPYPGPSPTSPEASSVPAYPPWFFLFMYKMADMPFGLAMDTVMGMFIPLIILLLVPALDRSDALHPLDRPWITALFITGLTWVIELSVWSAIQPGVPVKMQWFAITIIPPVVISFGGIYAIRRVWFKVKGELSGSRNRGAGFRLSKGAALSLGYLTSILAIIAIVVSFFLNPIMDGPYVGVMWGTALISFAASLLAYFYVEYIQW
ncbi:cytochrome b [Caldivirga sp. UBA161]|uniref:cytochrome b n=1 Tax=Caldivirga sp. UBA161 TaxID=1915569 RepID=UPI0025BA2D05|nr:cytochrome bc complex cytochrome b subunit [Caldivirga sp. UBA161]